MTARWSVVEISGGNGEVPDEFARQVGTNGREIRCLGSVLERKFTQASFSTLRTARPIDRSVDDGGPPLVPTSMATPAATSAGAQGEAVDSPRRRATAYVEQELGRQVRSKRGHAPLASA
jgi:hypothetical protein